MSRLFAAMLAIGIIMILVFSSAFSINQSEQALVLQLGEPKRAITEPGLHWRIPFIQNVVYTDKRVLDLEAPAEEVIAADQKRLVVDTFARYKIVDQLRFYQSVGSIEAVSSRLASIVNSSLRRVLGGQKFQVMLTGERQQMMKKIRDLSDAEAKTFGVEVIDVRIKRADLPAANSQAIYRRMQTEREREAREFRAQGAEASQMIKSQADREKSELLANARKTSEIKRGEGDAEAIKIFAESFGSDPEFFSFYRSIKAYKESLGLANTTLVLSPDSNEFLKFFNVISGGKN